MPRTPKPICDARRSAEVLIALSCESRSHVRDRVRSAVAAGGTTYDEEHDHGFMLQDGYSDLDGHIWELVYMEPSALQSGAA
jgi:predicted lactoylglutathione lyase